MNNAIRWLWICSIGWWLGPFIFISGLAISLTVIGFPLGYKMMDSAYNWTTLKFE